MSSLAEINKELQKQSADIADMKANIASQLKAEILAQKKEDRQSGRREEARREAQRKSPKGLREGFAQGIGIGGASGMVDGFLRGFFGTGAGILAAILGSVGLAAGKLVKGTVLVGLLSTFGEKAIKALFDKLQGTALDLKLTKEQEDSFASKTTDGLMAFFLTGLVFRNPLVRLGSALIFAFKDEILGGLEKYLGIKITNLGGKDGYVVSFNNRFFDGDVQLPGFGENFGTAIGALFSGFMLWAVGKFTSGVAWILRGGKSKAQAKFDKILKAQQAEFDKQLSKIEDQFKAVQVQQEAYQKYGTSRTTSEQNRLTRLQQEALAQIDTTNTTKLVALADDIDSGSGKYVTKGGRTLDVEILGRTADGSRLKVVDVKRPQLEFTVDPTAVRATSADLSTSKSSASAAGDTIKTPPKDLSTPNFNKVMKTLNVLSIEGIAENLAQYGAGKTTGSTSRVLGGFAKFLGGSVGLAGSFVMGGLFENIAGDGTISGILDGHAYNLMQAMANGASDEEIMRLQGELNTALGNYGSGLASEVTMLLANASASDLKNLRNMVYAQTTGQIFGSKTKLGGLGGKPGSARIGNMPNLQGEELNALDVIAANNARFGNTGTMQSIDASQTNVSVGGNNNTIMPSMPQVSDYYDNRPR